MAKFNQAEIDKRFDHHPPDEETQHVHAEVRRQFKSLATYVAVILPESRETSLAITSLEESLMWANASIARNPLKED